MIFKDKISTSKISIYHFISLLPLLLYGFYKNALSVFMNSNNIFDLMYPIILVGIFFLIILLNNFIRKKSLTMNDFYLFSVILFIPLNTSYIVILPLFILFYILSNTSIKLPFSTILILLYYIIFNYLGVFTLENSMEATISYNYTNLDLFIGKEISAYFTSSMLCALLSYCYLIYKGYFKKNISLTFMISYFCLGAIASNISSFEFEYISLLFIALMYVGSNFMFSFNTFKGTLIYSFILALITILLSIFIPSYIAIFICILLLQMTYLILNKRLKKYFN